MQATMKQLQALAAEMGAEVEYEAETGDVYAYSPRGKTWDENGASIMVEACEQIIGGKRGSSWKPRAFGIMLERMRFGVSDDPDYPGWWQDEDGEA